MAKVKQGRADPSTLRLLQRIQALRKALAKWQRHGGDTGRLPTRLAELLGEMTANLGGGRDRKPIAQRARHRRSEGVESYQIEISNRGAFLAEHRPGYRQPFRCSHRVYQAAAKALAANAKGILFDELMDAVTSMLGQRPPEYAVRVALRFWTAGPTKLVERIRSRYSAISAASFAAAADRAWTESIEMEK